MRLDCDFKIAEKCLDRVPLTLGSLRKEIALRMSSCRSGLPMTVEIQIRMSSTTRPNAACLELRRLKQTLLNSSPTCISER